MNKIILFLVLIISGFAQAQIVNIPDANFKNFLVNYQVTAGVPLDTNGDGEIQVSEAQSLTYLSMNANPVADFTGLQEFVNLEGFDLSNNNTVTSIDFSGMENLYDVEIEYNINLVSLNFNGCISLYSVQAYVNNLSSLNLSDCPALEIVQCYSNQLTTLDLSDSPLLTTLYADTNPLTFVRIKNGIVSQLDNVTIEADAVTQLFICADEGEEVFFEPELQLYPNMFITSYCSFTPGGDYNTITGTIKFDSDNNSCATGDPMQFTKVHINDGTDSGYTFANASGEYTFYTQAGSFTITPEFENAYFIASPLSATANFPVVDNSVQIHDFCTVPNGVHNDIEVIMVPVIPANPGFEAVYKIVYRNKGNQVLSGTVNCVWDSTEFSTFQLSPPPSIQSQGDYTWNYINLLPYESREIMMTLLVNTPSDPTNPVEVGDFLNFTATAALTGDEMPQDNLFVLNQEVIGSFDPNNIICIEGETAMPDAIGEYLHYVVNFENTGTAPATFIVVTNEINPADFDISTLQVLNSSHGVTANIEGNTLEFIFEDINLGVMDHGNILFKLKTRPNLMQGDNVANQANIYFDYNFPVETNDAITTFGMLTSGHFEIDPTIMLYPNPTNDIVNIAADNTLGSVELYDIQGRVLETHLVDRYSTKIDLSKRAAGMYFLKIRTDVGVKVEKVMKN